MDKKFIAAVVVCVVALTAVATGTYFLGEKSDENIVKLKNAKNIATTADNNKEVAQEVIEETTVEGDRVADDNPFFAMKNEGETEVVGVDGVVEENTESNVSKKDYLYGLSEEAAAQIDNLSFNKNSKISWPVQGSVIMPYNMKNTIYFATLNEYKCNPGVVIKCDKGSEVKAVTSGVITKIYEDDQLGVCIKQAIGNDYITTYGQIVNPSVKAGDYVEKGQVIAQVNKTTKYYAKEGDNLYLAMEKNGKTVDPMKFIDYED